MKPRSKKKKKTFRASKAVKAAAREQIGSPRPGRIETPRPLKPPRHKPTLGHLLAEELRELRTSIEPPKPMNPSV